MPCTSAVLIHKSDVDTVQTVDGLRLLMWQLWYEQGITFGSNIKEQMNVFKTSLFIFYLNIFKVRRAIKKVTYIPSESRPSKTKLFGP